MSSDERGEFTCESCGRTFPKGWSDEEAAAEAEGNFPGIDVTDPAESGLVCDDCYERIMARARAEAPELIGPGWRGDVQPIPDFPGFVASLLANGYTRNPCRDHCQDKGVEHEHLRSPGGSDGIIWADGHVSEFDLTQPARLIYPTYAKRRPLGSLRPEAPYDCYRMPNGSAVHVKPGCRC